MEIPAIEQQVAASKIKALVFLKGGGAVLSGEPAEEVLRLRDEAAKDPATPEGLTPWITVESADGTDLYIDPTQIVAVQSNTVPR